MISKITVLCCAGTLLAPLAFINGCGSSDDSPADSEASEDGTEEEATPVDSSDDPDEQETEVEETDGEETDDVDPETPTTVRDDVLAGVFEVELRPEVVLGDNVTPPFAAAIGRVDSGPTPEGTVWDVLVDTGECQLLEPSIPFCDGGCGGQAVCTDDSTCTEFPEPQDVGTVQLAGVELEDGETVLSMDPLPPSFTYQPIGVRLAFPPFAEGDELTLEASGGSLDDFSAVATGIAPLVVLGDDSVALVPNEPTLLQWEPPTDPSQTTILIEFDISHHGGQKGAIECEVDDDGEFEVSAELVTGLIDLGFSGFPTVVLVRRSSGDTATVFGRVEFRVSSAIEKPIEIPGLVSCGEIGASDECPEGEVCQQDLKCG